MEDELKILDYSCVISDSPRLRLAINVTGSLAELVQVSAFTHKSGGARQFIVVITFRNPAQEQMGTVKSLKRHLPSLSRWSKPREKAKGMLPSYRTP
jgi:hypothetical protein